MSGNDFNSEMKQKRSEFMNDLHDLLKTHERFIDDPFYEDYQGDNWDFVLDDCNNLFVKWILKND